jgi:hypothetical protein
LFLLASLLSSPCNAHPVYALAPVVYAQSVRRDGSVYRASARLTFRIVEKRPAVITSVDPGLLEHVRGHQIVAQRVARSSGGTVQAVGSSRAQAQARLRQALSRLAADQERELDREEHVYDSVTNYGAAQDQGPQYGFPGGLDVRSQCAQPQ